MKQNINKGQTFYIKKNIYKLEKSIITTTFSAILLDNDIIITDVYNITPEAPLFIFLSEKYNFSKEDKCKIIYNFIKDRSLSNEHENLDKALIDAYNLRKDINNYRLFNSQYTLTLLKGAISPFDDYFITPTDDIIISFANINPKFWNIWLLESNKTYKKFLQADKNIHKYCCNFKDFTKYESNNDDTLRVIYIKSYYNYKKTSYKFIIKSENLHQNTYNFTSHALLDFQCLAKKYNYNNINKDLLFLT